MPPYTEAGSSLISLVAALPGAAVPRFSRPWMVRFLDAAAADPQLEDACNVAGVTLIDYQAGRQADRAFDECCRDLDRLIDLRITEALRHLAIEGDIRAQTLYFGRVRDLILAPPSRPEPDTPAEPDEAESLIHLALRAIALRPVETREPRPHDSPSRPDPFPTLESRRPTVSSCPGQPLARRAKAP